MKPSKLLSLLAALLLAGASASAQEIEYYSLDALGSIRVVTDRTGKVIERHDYLPFGEECTTGPCTTNPGVGAGQPRKFTGKERDTETGLDYFGARYYGSRIGRFTTTDPVYTWRENLLDPQRWNRYVYVRNNPLRYTDPDGRVIDTIWDVGNLIYDVYTGIRTGDWTDLGVDAIATAIPFVPAGASKLRHLNKLDDAVDFARGSERLLPFKDPDRMAEVNKALDRIEGGGPFVHGKDGTFFRNREGKLPGKDDADYYREFTVETPGATNRGTRRIVQGKGGETYYTDDHYKSFVQIDPKKHPAQ